VLVLGDFNARALAWDTKTNARGEPLLECLAGLGFTLLNEGRAHTTFHPRGTSAVDTSWANERACRLIEKWSVATNVEIFSDHWPIIIGLVGDVGPARRSRRTGARLPRWSVARLDSDGLEAGALAASWAPLANSLSAEQFTARMSSILSDICDGAMPRAPAGGGLRKPLYWWSADIAELRARCVRARRKLWRRRGRHQPEALTDLWTELRAARRELRHAIGDAKRRAWKELLQTLEADPWGRPYWMVLKKIRAPTAPICELLPADVMKKILGGLFPVRAEESLAQITHQVDWDSEWDITEEEVARASKRLSLGRKAPGPDGIPGAVIRRTAGLLLGQWARGFTTCLREAVFPARWKMARLVLLQKKGKPEGEPSSYRPICLLDEAGKLLERVLAERLREWLDAANGLSSDQFGFRRGRTTVDAILRLRGVVDDATGEGRVALVIGLDVANAFNSLPWSVIAHELTERGVPLYLRRILHSYLNNRRLCYVEKGGAIREIGVTCGVPQGSVLGPILWNVGYNRVLRAELPPGCETIGYADDTAIVVVLGGLPPRDNRTGGCVHGHRGGGDQTTWSEGLPQEDRDRDVRGAGAGTVGRGLGGRGPGPDWGGIHSVSGPGARCRVDVSGPFRPSAYPRGRDGGGVGEIDAQYRGAWRTAA